MEFILGCNYWASNAGAEMWREFDAEVIDKDLSVLSEYGVTHIRAFPNWRDFQHVRPLYHGERLIRYEAENCNNPYYLDEKALDRFETFLDICKKHNIRVLVGLITGGMSGRLFIPPALYNKNIITDTVSQYFQQLFITGFVNRFKERDEIFAWDLGNECNGMGAVSDRYDAANWTAMISNAIRAADNSRPVVSGMHGLGLENNWTIQDQGLFTDMLTTHPYPYWCEHTRIDETLSLRTTMHATAQTKFYSEISKNPCLAEEIGTMGPMICDDEKSADFLRLNLFSLFANGSPGVMWWCACDQTELSSFPYTDQMVELELGLLDKDGKPKPTLCEIKKFAEFIKRFGHSLPKAERDAVCILTSHQRQWGVAYMSHILARQAGFNVEFAYCDDTLPDAKLYLLPSINGCRILGKVKYEELKRRVHEGADLYISFDNAVLSEFESLTGLHIEDSYETPFPGKANFDGEVIEFSRKRNLILHATSAKILAADDNGSPFITVNRCGKGRVFFVNAPIEESLIDKHHAFDGNAHIIFKKLFGEYSKNHLAELSDKELTITHHKTEKGEFAIIINHSDKEKKLNLKLTDGYRISKTHYGDKDSIKPFDACVIEIEKI